MPRNLLTPERLADEVGVPPRTVAQWRYFNRGPAYIKVGRHIRYRREDVDAWLTEQRRGGTDAAA